MESERERDRHRTGETENGTDRQHYVLFVYLIYPNKEINVGSAVKV